jgi:hypothetical protein
MSSIFDTTKGHKPLCLSKLNTAIGVLKEIGYKIQSDADGVEILFQLLAAKGHFDKAIREFIAYQNGVAPAFPWMGTLIRKLEKGEELAKELEKAKLAHSQEAHLTAERGL